MALLIIAWIPETLQNWRERGRNLNLKFVCLYLFGDIFLAYHAYTINDGVFLLLNVLAGLIAIFNAAVILLHPGGPKAGKKGGRKK